MAKAKKVSNTAALIFKRSEILRLTSPWMKGLNVKEMQLTLTHTRFGDTLKDAKGIDGEFGPATAKAVRLAKWHAGYAQKQINDQYDRKLHSYLVPKGHPDYKPLPPANALRRKLRLKARNTEAQRRKDAYQFALTQVGIKESPAGTNRVKYSVWYNMIGPWCAMFVTWIGISNPKASYATRVKSFFKQGARWAYVPYMVADAEQGRYGGSITKKPQLMDIVCYQFGSRPDHTGYFVEWAPKQGAGYFWAIEGNTGASNADGGQVQLRLRHISDVHCFIRVPW